MTHAPDESATPRVEVTPVMVVTRRFDARPRAWAEARDFLAETLAGLAVDRSMGRSLQTAIGESLLASAGTPENAFLVSVRIFPEQVEIEMLSEAAPATDPAAGALPSVPAPFARWLTQTLSATGLSQEQAARQLGVSVRTVGRWVRGETEPRLRDVRRVTRVFGGEP
jgi:DNA-binding XRE family transcriptional regulator